MKRPLPQDVNTDGHFYNVCEGMRHGCEAEDTVRLFCLTAKDHNRWELSQAELDQRDTSGEFYWNGTLEAGYFEKRDSKYVPTEKCFGSLMKEGRILLT